jgi:hydroxypyruvate isomerase
MLKIAANLTTLFQELPLIERFGAAREHGFSGAELLFPYALAAEEFRAALGDSALKLVQFNLPPGDWDAGDRGLAVDPARRGAFLDSLELALDYATSVGASQLHCMAGIVPEGLAHAEAHATYTANLRAAARRAGQHGIRLMIEPINTLDMPGYFLKGSAQAASIMREVAADNLCLQFDVYHIARMGEPIAPTLDALFPLIRHIQIADVPGRHEPGTGTIDWRSLFNQLLRLGYQGWIGCEYFPVGTTSDGLDWRTHLLDL